MLNCGCDGCRESKFTFTAIAILRPGKRNEEKVTVHTDGVILETEESLEDRKAGFIPAYRLKPGRTYRITIEELPPQ